MIIENIRFGCIKEYNSQGGLNVNNDGWNAAHSEIVKDLIDLATRSCTKSRFKISSLSNFGENLRSFYTCMYVRSHAEKVAESFNKFNIQKKALYNFQVTFGSLELIDIIFPLEIEYLCLNSISHSKSDAKIVACFFFD